MKINVKEIRPYLNPKAGQVLDPPRFPKIIRPYENDMKRSFTSIADSLISQITQKMVEFKK